MSKRCECHKSNCVVCAIQNMQDAIVEAIGVKDDDKRKKAESPKKPARVKKRL